MSTASETDIAWAAGLFEGEGHLTIRHRGNNWRSTFEMGVTSTDHDVVERFAAIVQCGNVRRRETRNGWKTQYVWTCGGTKARTLADRFRPYLGARRTARLTAIERSIAESQPHPRPCEQCGETFSPTRFARERFCSDTCRYRAKYLRGKSVTGAIPGTRPEDSLR